MPADAALTTADSDTLAPRDAGTQAQAAHTTSAMLRWFRGEAASAPAPAPAPSREARRLAALSEYDILDTEGEAQFDLIVRLASELTGSPVAVLNLVAADRVWAKAAVGLPRGQALDRHAAYCSSSLTCPRACTSSTCGPTRAPATCRSPWTRATSCTAACR